MKIELDDYQIEDMKKELISSLKYDIREQIEKTLPGVIEKEIKRAVDKYDPKFSKTQKQLKERLVKEFTSQAIHWGAIGAGQALQTVVSGELRHAIERAIEQMRSGKQ